MLLVYCAIKPSETKAISSISDPFLLTHWSCTTLTITKSPNLTHLFRGGRWLLAGFRSVCNAALSPAICRQQCFWLCSVLLALRWPFSFFYLDLFENVQQCSLYFLCTPDVYYFLLQNGDGRLG